MLLPWPDIFLYRQGTPVLLCKPELRLVLSAERIEVTLIKRHWFNGFKPEIITHENVDLNHPMLGMEASTTYFATLAHILTKYQDKKAIPVVILSSLFSRHLVIPWSDAVKTKQESAAYISHLFKQSYGEASTNWRIASFYAHYGQPAFASAIHQTFLDELESVFTKAGMSLRAIHPQFMLAANKAFAHIHQHRLPLCGWIACLESTRLTIGRIEAGAWRSVQSMPLESSAAMQIEKWIIRETVISPEAAKMPVFVDGSSEAGSHIRLSQHQVIDLQPKVAVSRSYGQTPRVRHSL